MVVAQLVEGSLLTPEIRGSKPVIGENLSTNLSTNCIMEKKKIKKKRPGMAIFKKAVVVIDQRQRIISLPVIVLLGS